MKPGRVSSGPLLPWVAALLLIASPLEAAGAETKSFVVNWFNLASYFSDGDCPAGLNPKSAEFYRRDLLRTGHSQQDVDAVLKDFPGEGGAPQPWIALVIGRGNGKDNIYADPTTGPDPGLNTVTGRFGYGFNLDGLGEKSPNGLEDPITHERGIDNQAYRAFSCIRGFRGPGRNDGPARSNGDEVHWDKLREEMPAMVISVTAANGLATDGDVSVVMGRALETVTRDASGTNVQSDMTYTLDPDPRTRNMFTGHLHQGVITADPSHINLVGDNYMVASFEFDKARLRLNLKPDGTLEGMVGGYMPWFPLYHGLSVGGYVEEYALSLDLPGLYYALKKLADSDPDPKTGENRSISAAYAIDAVRAFVIDQQHQKTAANQPQNAPSGTPAP
jgi:hypothetical protein